LNGIKSVADERNKMMKLVSWEVARHFWIALVIGLSLAGIARAQTAPSASAVSVNGKISSITGSDITVMSNSGPVVVKFAGETVIRGEVPVKFSDITSGMYVGATAEKQPDALLAPVGCTFSPKTSAAPEKAIGRWGRRRRAARR
jgi:hypothetical protein